MDEAVAYVQEQTVKNADETSWRQGNKRAWLWTVVTASVAVFMIQATRSADAARAILGEVRGILCTDRYAGYAWWPTALRQVCWSHLVRDFTAIAERGGDSERVGNALLAEAQRMFAWWHRVRDGKLSRRTFHKYMGPVRDRVESLLREGQLATQEKTARTCAKILAILPALWTFVDVEGVEPTNNVAEQTVRHGVLYRKVSFGTHSDWGSDFVARILTVHATCKKQHRSALQFILDSCKADLTGRSPPSLLPALGQPASDENAAALAAAA